MTVTCSAVLFDLDETLVYSGRSIATAWKQFADRHGVDFAQLSKTLPGRRGKDIVRQALPQLGEAEIARELDRVRRLEVGAAPTIRSVPGARALLEALPLRRWAVVTAAPRRVMIARLRGACLPCPKVTVCDEDVVRGKPSPEGYLKACQLLGVDPTHCHGFEDSPSGLIALRRAGISSIAVSSADAASSDPATATISHYRGIKVHREGKSMRVFVP